jgi:flagellar basal-body rod protein FlgB
MDPVSNRDQILSRLLSATSLRAQVLADNVANQNVPGYQRRVVSFEEALRERVAAGRSLEGLAPTVAVDATSPASPDGNNVSLELETNGLRENWLAFQLYAEMAQSRIGLIQAAITESR